MSPATLNHHVRQIRYHSMEIRRLTGKLNAGQLHGATSSARRRHEAQRAELTRALHHTGHSRLAVLLVEEANLRARMQSSGHGEKMALKLRLDSVLQDVRLLTRKTRPLMIGALT